MALSISIVWVPHFTLVFTGNTGRHVSTRTKKFPAQLVSDKKVRPVASTMVTSAPDTGLGAAMVEKIVPAIENARCSWPSWHQVHG